MQTRTNSEHGRAARHAAAGLLLAALMSAAGTAIAQTDYPVPGATPQAAGLISNFEGFSATPYNDAQTNGNCTIGYGTLLHRGPCTAADTAAYPNGITRQQGLDMLQNEANAAANTVDRNVHVPLTQQQRDALTSFVYNVGPGAFQNSTLLRDINSGNSAGAADQLLRWVNQNGHFVPGLQNRRNAERCYFLAGSTQCQGQLRDARRALALSRARVSASAAGGHGRARLTLIGFTARAGTFLRYRGRGWAPGRVKVYAYVPGISPYQGAHLVAKAGPSGGFTARWKPSRRIVDRMRWRVTGTQNRGGHRRSASFYVKIRPAPGD